VSHTLTEGPITCASLIQASHIQACAATLTCAASPNLRRHPNLRHHPNLRCHPNLRRHPNLRCHPNLRRHPNLRCHPNLRGHPNLRRHPTPPPCGLPLVFVSTRPADHSYEPQMNDMLSGGPAPSGCNALEQMGETHHPVEASDGDDKAVTVTRSAMATDRAAEGEAGNAKV
jgi:hypothetical protein